MVRHDVFFRFVRTIEMKGAVRVMMVVADARVMKRRMPRTTVEVPGKPVARHGDSLEQQRGDKTNDDLATHGGRTCAPGLAGHRAAGLQRDDCAMP